MQLFRRRRWPRADWFALGEALFVLAAVRLSLAVMNFKRVERLTVALVRRLAPRPADGTPEDDARLGRAVRRAALLVPGAKCLAQGTAGMIVCPCSMGTVSAIAQGSSRSLVERAADVTLKERRKLILVPRETPFSLIHLRNLVQVTEAGAVVLPAAPGFYHKPARIEELVDFVVQRVLDQLQLEISVAPRWGG